MSKRRWRIVFITGAIAEVRADTYEGAVERAKAISRVSIRDVVLIEEAKP